MSLETLLDLFLSSLDLINNWFRLAFTCPPSCGGSWYSSVTSGRSNVCGWYGTTTSVRWPPVSSVTGPAQSPVGCPGVQT